MSKVKIEGYGKMFNYKFTSIDDVWLLRQISIKNKQTNKQTKKALE